MDIKRGELYYADLSPVVGSEQGGVRPVLVVQNDIGNKYSPTIIAAARYEQDQQSQTSHSHRTSLRQLRIGEGLRHSARTDPHLG